jgi:hypothetical protein
MRAYRRGWEDGYTCHIRNLRHVRPQDLPQGFGYDGQLGPLWVDGPEGDRLARHTGSQLAELVGQLDREQRWREEDA